MDRNVIRGLISNIESLYPDLHGELLIAINGQSVFNKAYNCQEQLYPINLGMNYLIGSITKQFTAAAILRILSKQNQLQLLHSPIANLGLEESLPAWSQQVTIDHLLSHRSGIKKIDDLQLSDQLESEPGQKFNYQNASYLLLGRIIEKLSGQTLSDYFRTELFEAAKMTNTVLPESGDAADLKNTMPELALGFEFSALDARLTDASIDFSVLGAAGGIVSNTKDLVQWNQALFSGQILPDYVLKLMLTGYGEKPAFPLYDGIIKHIHYGYGIESIDLGSQLYHQHCGSVPGYVSRLAHLSEFNIDIVHLSNAIHNNAEIVQKITSIAQQEGCNHDEAKAILDKRFDAWEQNLEPKYGMFAMVNAFIRKVYHGSF